MARSSSPCAARRCRFDRIRSYCDGTSLVYAMMGALSVVMICCELFADFTSVFSSGFDMIMLVSAAVFAVVLAVRKKLFDNAQSALLAAYALWLAATRAVLGTEFFSIHFLSRLGFTSFAAVVCFNFPRLIGSDRLRSFFLKAVSLVLGAFTLIMTALSLAAVFFGLHDGPVFSRIFLIPEDHRLQFFKFLPLISGLYTNLGICAALVLAVTVKRRAARIACAACIPVMLLMLSLNDARASKYLAGLCVGAAAGMWLFSRYREKINSGGQRLRKIALAALCVAAGAAIMFGTIKFVPFMTNNINAWTSAKEQAAYSEGSGQDAPPPPAPELDNREMNLETVVTLTYRTTVYEYAFTLMRDEPSILAAGKPYSREPFYVPQDDGSLRFFSHLHSGYITSLYETGVVGFLLYAVFTVLCVIQMIKVFFGSFSRHTLADRIIVLPVGVLLTVGVLEPVIYGVYGWPRFYLAHILLMLFAGYVRSSCSSHK